MTRLVLVRHAETLKAGETPGAEWPLTEKGKNDSEALGAHIAAQSAAGRIVWTSRVRRARETAELAFPLVEVHVRMELGEVRKPWYASSDEVSKATANYLNRRAVEGWEPHEEVLSRIAQLKSDFGTSESLVLVSHGVFLTTWLDEEIGLDDPFSFWIDLRMPDAWEFDVGEKSLTRIL